jgi:drug/metabolite transporter (DMT)-like permease
LNAVAAVLAVLASISFALAATLWQRAAMTSGVKAGDAKGFLGLLTNWVWLLGLVAQIVGVVLQAGALDRGRVSIIQPLLVTTVIWAMPLGYILTHQTITRRHILGAAIIVVGLAVFASVGDPAAGVDNAPTSDWVAALFVIAIACAGLMLFGRRGGLSVQAAVLGTTAGILYGVSAVLMKPVVENLHAEGFAAVLESWELWVMAAGGLLGFYLQQMSLATGRLVTSVATVSVANPVISVLLGALVLQERLDKTPPWHAVVAIGALAVALLGAVIIASATEEDEEIESATGNGPTPIGQPSLG